MDTFESLIVDAYTNSKTQGRIAKVKLMGGGEVCFDAKTEASRIWAENQKAARELNPEHAYIARFEKFLDAWEPRKGKADLCDASEMAWRESHIKTIMRG